jgi:hypothetical protein
MKVFFTASHRGKKYFEENYQKIHQIIESLGNQLLEDDILVVPELKFYQELNIGGEKAVKQLYEKKIKCIQEADTCVFEASIPSVSIGYQVRKSLELNKPTAVLYFKNNPPHFLLGAEEEKLIFRSYTEHNLKQIVEEILTEANKMRDKRFNFFIGTDLLNYLEETSKNMKITKSTFIRNLILDHKKKHIE